MILDAPSTDYLFQDILIQIAFSITGVAAVLVLMGLTRTRRLQFWRCLLLVLGLVSASSLGFALESDLATLQLATAIVFGLCWRSTTARIITTVTGAITFLIMPSLRPHGCGSQLTMCKSNLKNTAAALEMYRQDHGAYPRKLGQLTPTYLKIIPDCPSTQRNCYLLSVREDRYTLFCFGSHEVQKVPYGFPRYSSHQGLIER